MSVRSIDPTVASAPSRYSAASRASTPSPISASSASSVTTTVRGSAQTWRMATTMLASKPRRRRLRMIVQRSASGFHAISKYSANRVSEASSNTTAPQSSPLLPQHRVDAPTQAPRWHVATRDHEHERFPPPGCQPLRKLADPLRLSRTGPPEPRRVRYGRGLQTMRPDRPSSNWADARRTSAGRRHDRNARHLPVSRGPPLGAKAMPTGHCVRPTGSGTAAPPAGGADRSGPPALPIAKDHPVRPVCRADPCPSQC